VNPFGVTIVDGIGSWIVVPTVSEQMASWATCADQPKPTTVLGYPCLNGSGNDTIYFVVSGFENIQRAYSFNVQTFANDTGTHVMVLRFVGVQPLSVIGTTIASKSYDFSNKWQQVTFNALTTDPNFQIVYGSVSGNIGNGVTLGAALLVILVLVVSIAFIIIVALLIVPSDREKVGVGQFIISPLGLMLLVVVFVIILALIAAFFSYFKGIGL
jgi:hypothetical protein